MEKNPITRSRSFMFSPLIPACPSPSLFIPAHSGLSLLVRPHPRLLVLSPLVRPHPRSFVPVPIRSGPSPFVPARPCSSPLIPAHPRSFRPIPACPSPSPLVRARPRSTSFVRAHPRQSPLVCMRLCSCSFTCAAFVLVCTHL